MPLYLVIQARTGLLWGLSVIFDKELDELGLVVIDHRSWHPRGLDAVVVSEIYVEDNKTLLSIPDVNPDETIDSDIQNLVVAGAEADIIDMRCEEVAVSKLTLMFVGHDFRCIFCFLLSKSFLNSSLVVESLLSRIAECYGIQG